LAHQIATAVVFNSPLLTYAAHPRSLLDNAAAPLIKQIPATWDETIVLPSSEIGEIAAFARRSGDCWFLGIVNGPAARELSIPLAFLGQGEFAAMTACDDEADSAAVRFDEHRARPSDTARIQLSPGGGFVARYAPQ
jgi:alpha-glucosidase